jgi:hypothetical protein
MSFAWSTDAEWSDGHCSTRPSPSWGPTPQPWLQATVDPFNQGHGACWHEQHAAPEGPNDRGTPLAMSRSRSNQHRVAEDSSVLESAVHETGRLEPGGCDRRGRSLNPKQETSK